MKKAVITSLSAILLMSPLAACSDKTQSTAGSEQNQAAGEQSQAAGEQSQPSADKAAENADLKAFADLKGFFSQSTPDLNQVKATYTSTVQPKVKELIPDTDAAITTVLDGAIQGAFTAAQAKQAIDKGLQGYFYAEITRLTKTVAADALKAGNKEEARAALDQAIELYTGALQGTVGKRDSAFGTNMQEQLDKIVIPALQADVDKGDLLSYGVHRQMFDKTLIKMFHLATLTYAKKAPDLAASGKADEAKAAITEGYFFYLPIYKSLSSVNKEAADLIKTAFESGDPAKLKEAGIKDAFLAALSAKVSGYAEKVLAADFNDQAAKEKAQVQAMEGNMFLSAAEILLKERIGEKGFADLSAKAQAYYEAVQAGDKTKANEQVSVILKELDKLNK